MEKVTSLEAIPATLPGKRPFWLRWLPLLLIWLLALGLRLALTQVDRVVWGDEPFYLWLGRNWVTGQGFSFTGHPDVHHGPLFPWLVGLVYLVTRDLALASEVLYILFGSLLVWPVYALGKEIYDRRVGLVAAALTAVFPALSAAVLHWGSLTEPIYLFCVYGGLWAGARILRPLRNPSAESARPGARDPWWVYGLAGLAFGLAYLTRPEAIGYVALLGLLWVVLRLGLRRLEARFWPKLLLFGAAFALCFIPYAYYTWLNTGSWMVSEKVGVAYLTGIGLAHGDTAAFDRATWGLDSTGLETFFFSSESYNVSMWQLILADPKTFLNVLTMNALRLVQVLIDWSLFPYPLLPLVVLGLFRRGWTRERTIGEIFLLVSMLPVIGFVLFFIQARYLVPLIPVFILWTACGLGHLSDWLLGTVVALRTPPTADGLAGRSYWHVGKGWRAILDWGPLCLLLVGLLWVQPRVVRQVTDVGSVRPEHRLVGAYLATVLPPDAVLMSRYPAIAFHAGTKWVPTPNASWAEILRYARHKGVSYWAIDERELRYRPQLANLVTGEHVPSELQLFYQSDAGGERLVVFRFVE